MRRRSIPCVLLVLAGCSTAPRRAVDELFASAYIAASYDAVWDRFTLAELFAEWYSSPCLEFGTRAGDRCVWGTAEQITHRGTLVDIEKGKGLTYTFQFQGFGFDEPPTPVAIGIVAFGPTVLVTIRHDCAGAPRTRGVITEVGWLKSLSRLKTLLEAGHPMPWPTEPSRD